MFEPHKLDENATSRQNRNVENQGKQYDQAQGATRSKLGGYV